MTPARTRIAIIGAGPAGLGAALRLQELAEDGFEVFEGMPAPGGLSSSFVDDAGFTWDLGGHVQFSHYEKFDDYMRLALGDDGWLTHQRESWVWVCGGFVPYPFQNNLHGLPAAQRWECVRGLLDAQSNGHNQYADLASWIRGRFGSGISDLFLLPYNYKVWAYPAASLGTGWMGERIAVPALTDVLRSVCLAEDNVAWGPNSTFRFPRSGGTGQVWRNLAARLPGERLHLGDPVVSVDTAEHLLVTRAGLTCRYDALISTMPVDVLVKTAGMRAEQNLCAGLLHSGTHVVGVGLKGRPPEHLRSKCWMYFPENDCPFYRVTVFSNYSPLNTPDPEGTWSLMAEVSHSPARPVVPEQVVDDVMQGLISTGLISPRDTVLSKWHRYLDYGYPTPSTGRDRVLEAVLPALEQASVYSRGRFGAWKYEVSNQDHSFMQGMEAVDHILSCVPEITLHHPNLVNNRRNPYPYVEWQRGDEPAGVPAQA